MRISCNPAVSVEEGLSVEFKTSILFSPDSRASQQEIIAKTVAAFINSDGGKLYIGVKDNGTITGVMSDISALSEDAQRFVVSGPHCTDAGFKYRATIDHYYLKFQKIVEAYLGKDALRFVKDYEKHEFQGLIYLVAAIERAVNGEYVYFCVGQRKEIWVRTPGANRVLIGEDRDLFIARKARETSGNNRTITDSIQELKNVVQRLFERRSNSQEENVQHLPELGHEDLNTEIVESQLSELMKDIQKILDCRKRDLCECREIYVEYNQRSSVTSIMDLFEHKKSDGSPMYRRLELRKESPLAFFPYEQKFCIESGYIKESWMARFPDVDFALDYVAFLVERDLAPYGNEEVLVTYRNAISFSALKKCLYDYPRVISFIWQEVQSSKDILSAPSNQWVTLPFSRFFRLEAHTTEQFNRVDEISSFVYRIVGVRFAKRDLYSASDKIPQGRFGQFVNSCRKKWCVPEHYDIAWRKHPSDYYTCEDY